MENEDIYSRIILQKEESQIRLTVSRFYEKEYISLREYYLDFDEEWRPSNKGINMPMSIPVSQELFRGLIEILSLEESRGIIENEFKEMLENLYDR